MTEPTKKSLEYSLLWKKINSSVSEEENELLNEWLQESSEHRQFYTRARNYKNINPLDYTETNWNELKVAINKRKKKRIRIYSLAASFALILGFSISMIYFHNPNDSQAEADVIPGPGVDKATLILSDGTSHVLDNESNLHLEEDGVTIEGAKGSLVYSYKDKKKSKITYNTIHVPRGGEFFLYLSDSTKVWINSETMLRYPISFPNNERRVELIGEAYFEVKKDKSKPFFVVSNQQVIEVTGTAFNVSTFGNEGSIVTTLVEGSVQISSTQNNEIIAKLVPGDQSLFDTQSQSIVVADVNVSLYTSWKDGYFFFQNETLESMLCTLSRWYNFDVDFKTEKVKSIRFSGKLKRTDSFQRILSIIEKTNELEFNIIGNQVIVN